MQARCRDSPTPTKGSLERGFSNLFDSRPFPPTISFWFSLMLRSTAAAELHVDCIGFRLTIFKINTNCTQQVITKMKRTRFLFQLCRLISSLKLTLRINISFSWMNDVVALYIRDRIYSE